MDFFPTSRVPVQVDAGDSSFTVDPSWRDPSGDPAWLASIGFTGDPYSPAWPVDEGAPDAVFRQGLGEAMSYGGGYYSTPVTRFEVAHGLHQQRGGGDYTLSWRYVDASGRQVGIVRSSTDHLGAVVGTVVQAVSTVVLAATGAQAAGAVAGGVSGATTGAATLAPTVEAPAAADALPQSAELSSSSPYDSFAYSSGEGTTATSDAANVDFGFGAQPDAGGIPATQVYPTNQDFVAQEMGDVVKGGTPESLTSDFGTTYPTGTWGPEQTAVYEAATTGPSLPTAVGAGSATIPSFGGLSGGGALSPILKAIFGTPRQAKPPITSNRGTSSTAAQNEIAQPIDYQGQLGVNNAILGAANGIGGMGWLAIGVGVLVVVYALRKG